MMKEFFVYDGKPSTDFNTFLANSNFFAAAAEDVTRESVPGRNGDIFISNNRYQNFALKTVVYIPDNVQKYIDGLKGFLLSRGKYCRYEESYYPNYFRMARFLGPFEPDPINKWQAGVELEFDCKPQKYLKQGELVQEYTSSSIIYNPTYYNAQPFIRVYGYGTVEIGDYAITIARTTYPYIDIDCERMDAYYGTVNCNNLISVSEFPVLIQGNNDIVLSNRINKIELTPRWWTV